MSPSYILEARNLVKQYPTVTAVDNVSFGIEPIQCFSGDDGDLPRPGIGAL